MNTYVSVIRESFRYFPVLAALITVPYIIFNYRRYGSVFSLRIAIFYSLVLYLLTVYFLIILPLPSLEEVSQLTGPRLQPVPFMFVFDIFKEARENGADLFHNNAFLQVVFNILMLTPFGMYLHYYYRCDLKKTVKYSFLLSLFFELTQLTGLYFYYPRPYRLFDVDDLMANTLGGFLGYYLIIPLMNHLPDREEIDRDSYEKGHAVSGFRRLTAFGIDCFIFALISTILALFSEFVRDYGYRHFDIMFLLYLSLSSILGNGQTPGLKFLRMRIVSTKDSFRRYQCALRYLLYYLILFRLPLHAINLFSSYAEILFSHDLKLYILAIGLLFYLLFLLMEFVMIMLRKPLFADRLSKTAIESEI